MNVVFAIVSIVGLNGDLSFTGGLLRAVLPSGGGQNN